MNYYKNSCTQLDDSQLHTSFRSKKLVKNTYFQNENDNINSVKIHVGSNPMACDQTNGDCKTLYDTAKAARKDWQTKHAASCKIEGQHTLDCDNAYKYYQTKLGEWTAKCCK